MTLHNEMLHTEFGLTHNRLGFRCHHYSAAEIDVIFKACSLDPELRERLWEYLDVKAAFYLRARDDYPTGTPAEHRIVLKDVRKLMLQANALADGIQRLEGWRMPSDPLQIETASEDASLIEEKRAATFFWQLASIAAGIRLAPDSPAFFPVYRSEHVVLVSMLLDYANTLQPISLISPEVKRGPEFDIQRRLWVRAVVQFWCHDIGRKFSSTCKPDEGKVSPMVRFVHACAEPIERNPSVVALAKLIKEIGPPSGWGY